MSACGKGTDNLRDLCTRSHAAQIEWHGKSFHVSWDSAAFNEDQDGQRLLYASSPDGRNWSEHSELFPSIQALWYGGSGSGALGAIHHHSRPFVTLNGRLYAVSNVAGPKGSWSSLYPTPPDLLPFTLLRRVFKPAYLDAGGCGVPMPSPPLCPSTDSRWTRPVFGPIFWATEEVPPGFVNASATFGIRTTTTCSTPYKRRCRMWPRFATLRTPGPTQPTRVATGRAPTHRSSRQFTL